MPSVAESVEWSTPLPDGLPGLRWSALSDQGATARVVIEGPERVDVAVADSSEHINASVNGRDVVVEIPPKTLPAGTYRLQAVVCHDGRQYVTPETPSRLFLRDAIV